MIRHLPPVPPAADPFARLYRDAWADGPSLLSFERERRIDPQATVAKTYARLPWADDFEYTGYLTRTRIYYARGEAHACDTFIDKPCVFHSHPQTMGADRPSLADLYVFLKFPMRRAITVGREWIWWWDKTPAILPVVRALCRWEATHMLPVMQAQLAEQGTAGLPDRYKAIALERVGATLDAVRGEVADWTAELRRILGLTTRLLRRPQE